MLADGVEASVRSLTSRDEASIRAMVSRIIDERLDDGQFDECDLTLRDIERIREAFVQQLLGHVPPADRVPAEQGRRARVARAAAGDEGRSIGGVSRSTGWGRGASTCSGARTSRGVVARDAARLGDRVGAGRRPGRRRRWGVADPDRRRRARRAQRDPHGQGRADGRAVVPAAAAGGVPAASGRARRGGRGPAAVRAPARAAAPPRGPRRLRRASRSSRPRQGRGGQTGDVRWTPADELRLLVTHGSLHLCGWDHAQPDEEAAMRALERRLLADG